MITNALKPRPDYDQLKMFAPVARVGAAPTLFIVKADSPIKTLPELIAKAKADSKMSYGSAGNGTTMHIAAEQLNVVGRHQDHSCAVSRHRARAQRHHGRPHQLPQRRHHGALPAGAAGHDPRARGRRHRASKLLPNVPTAQELGYKDVYMENWYGALVPAATPPDVVAKLEAAIMDALKNPAVWGKISANGVYAPQDAKTFRAQIEKDIAYWGARSRSSGYRRSSGRAARATYSAFPSPREAGRGWLAEGRAGRGE